MLDQIRMSGETQSKACGLFKLTFDEFITMCDEQYEYDIIKFKNGDVVNKLGENTRGEPRY